MPRHTRSSSSSHGRYSNPVPVSLAPSAMPIPYSREPQPLDTNINANFYGAVPSSTSPQMPMQPQGYDQYSLGVAQPAPMPTRASSGAWSPQDDQTLLAARQQDLNWQKISTTYFPNKSANACRKRHERLLERRGVDDWDARKMETIAKEYMSMRKEIWQGLAARTGEKWSTVEAKCMNTGLKNLMAASRSANRRQRLPQGPPMQGYDDDSGVSGIGLTHVDDLDPSYSSPETSSSHSHSSASSYGMHQHNPHHHMTAAISYGGANGYASSYSSSVSSMGHGYNGSAIHGHHPHHSQDSPTYMGNGQRPSSADMGIESIIHPTGHRS
ncbi:hypothetical protein F5Y17DRAFT_42060 [Xylariaceae sp. FL0594]|nr:hypothetical protein F5Y17DRAFT_42060 [Xylariaceae sp. FL0594]